MKNPSSGPSKTAPRRISPVFLVILALAAACALPPGVSAVAVDGSSRSYLQSRESYGGGSDLLPGYEYLDLGVRDIGSGEFSAHFGGWGRYDFEQESGDTDIQYAYLSYKRKQGNSIVNLGRQLVFEGVAAERVDGLYARTDLEGGFGISAFGGRPVETGINLPGNDLIFGSRLSHQAAGLYAVGVSYLREEKNSDRYREEEGVDVWFRPSESVEVLGRSSYESEYNEWKEHYYNLILGPFDKLRFKTEFANYNYEAYAGETTTAAFLFGTGVLDPRETNTLIGEEISYTATDTISLFANYRLHTYKIMGNASSYGGRLNYASGMTAAGLAVHRMDGDDNRLQYTRYRLYAARKISAVQVAVDLIDLEYDEAQAGEDNSYSATVALAYDVTPSLKIGADAEYFSGTVFDSELRLFAKIIYRFGFNAGGGAS